MSANNNVEVVEQETPHNNEETPLNKQEISALFNELSTTLITEIKSQLETTLKTFFDKKFNTIFKKIEEIKNTANEGHKIAKYNESLLNDMKEEYGEKIESLSTQNKNLNTMVESHVLKIHVLQTRLEDQVNRSCRKSLVIKGVPEQNHGKESWSETKTILSQTIAKYIPDTTEDDVWDMIERAHRSAPNIKNTKKKGKRDIFAAFHRWEDSNHIESTFQVESRKKHTNGIYIHQKYGADTTARRNMALIERKQLKSEGKIISGYLAYPAKLLVKHKNDTKYKLYHDFSDAEIIATDD